MPGFSLSHVLKSVQGNEEMPLIRQHSESVTRAEIIQTNKFGIISSLLVRFVENQQTAYIPVFSLTIDNQFFRSKARCRFTCTAYANKPDKFGVNFWNLAELYSK